MSLLVEEPIGASVAVFGRSPVSRRRIGAAVWKLEEARCEERSDISLDLRPCPGDDWSDDVVTSTVALMADGPDHHGLPGTVFTERLRLEPITSDHARDLWVIHNDDEVARWYGGSKPTCQEALEWARAMSYSWRTFGVHKWMAYHRETG